MSENESQNELLKLLRENNELAKKNNELLRSLYRHNIVGFTIRVIWYGTLIGLPFVLYFYVLEPYFTAVGSNYEVFRQGMAEIPGLKGLEHLLPSVTK